MVTIKITVSRQKFFEKKLLPRKLFFYSGHGHSRGDKGYIVPVDAPNPHSDDKGFFRKAVAMNQVVTWAKNIESKHALFLFDSCFSGTVFKSKNSSNIPRQITKAMAKPVRQFITAGSANEEVPARSTFTPAFIDAIADGDGDLFKDGYVTGQELGLYLQNIVSQYTDQTPQYGKIKDYKLSRGDFVFEVASKKTPKKNSELVSLETCSGEDKYSILLYKIATKLGRSCEIAESFLSSADSFISELQNNLSKVASTNTPIENKSEFITSILNSVENDQSCIEVGENKVCIPLQTLLSDLVALGDTAVAVKLDFQSKNKLGEIEKLDDDLYQISISKWERFINCKHEDEACDVNYYHRKFNIIFNNQLSWNMKVRNIELKEFLTENEYAQRYMNE